MRKISTLLLITIVVSFGAFAKNGSGSIRCHMAASHKSLSAQRDLLSQTIQIHFPTNINTIGTSITYLLRDSSYSLVAENQMTSALKNTLQKRLPLVDRTLGPITLREALTVLAGPAFILVEDPLNREVDFHLKPNFSNFSKNVHQRVGLWI
jgi:type IV pili sensor histidine kinase/response regulator